MKYAEYRQAGLPVTTAWMGSLVMEMNHRVKGTAMFWNDLQGAEAILQVRAASLCDDERLANTYVAERAERSSVAPNHPNLVAKKSRADVHP
jgi:hypothetical protein